ncbi:MAG: hypothetical protein OEZ47_03940 [Gammaproteobacteria bacterium]|nr:hypothetical protein [Gammaproteobacteria bacterium]
MSVSATMTPAIIDDLSDEITISINAPVNSSEAEVSLLELDRWKFDGGIAGNARQRQRAIRRYPHHWHEVPDSQNNFVARFQGTINRRRFLVSESSSANPSGNVPTIKIKFDGDSTVHEIRLPDARLRNEGSELEIGLLLRAKVRRRRREEWQEYRTTWPIFVRNFGDSTIRVRPVVSMHTNRAEGHRARNQYFSSAWTYWQTRADTVEVQNSVQGILQYITTRQNLEVHGQSRWGEVNIVSHANPYQWIIRLFSDRENNLDANGEELTRTDESNLTTENIDRLNRLHPTRDVLDSNSRIVLRGCAVGSNQVLLDKIRQLFGGQAKIFAPKYLQTYLNFNQGRGGQRTNYPSEALSEFYDLYTPHTGRRLARHRDVILREFAERFEHAGIDDDEWRRMWNSEGHRQRQLIVDQYVATIAYDPANRPPSNTAALQMLRNEWNRQFRSDAFNTSMDDWHWAVSRRRRQTNFSGTRNKVSLRRLLKDENGNVVVPNLCDPNHYGRSPAW